MVKWLGIAVLVLVSLALVLLGLGYLLTENKAEITRLKFKFDQQSHLREINQRKRLNRQTKPLNQSLSNVEQSLQQVISANLSCQTNKQCVVFETGSKALGCNVAVNVTGAIILIKVASSLENNLAIQGCATRDLSRSTACIQQNCLIE
jgi:hypothetical protein